MIDAHTLPPAEWWRLDGTDAAAIWPSLNPETAEVIVAERDGEILGHHIILPVLHVENLWIREAERGRAAVARRLWLAVKAAARGRGVSSVWTSAQDARVRALLEHVQATQVPGDSYLVSVEG